MVNKYFFQALTVCILLPSVEDSGFSLFLCSTLAEKLGFSMVRKALKISFEKTLSAIKKIRSGSVIAKHFEPSSVKVYLCSTGSFLTKPMSPISPISNNSLMILSSLSACGKGAPCPVSARLGFILRICSTSFLC